MQVLAGKWVTKQHILILERNNSLFLTRISSTSKKQKKSQLS